MARAASSVVVVVYLAAPSKVTFADMAAADKVALVDAAAHAAVTMPAALAARPVAAAYLAAITVGVGWGSGFAASEYSTKSPQVMQVDCAHWGAKGVLVQETGSQELLQKATPLTSCLVPVWKSNAVRNVVSASLTPARTLAVASGEK